MKENKLELLIHPPYVALIVVSFQFGMYYFFPFLNFQFPYANYCAILLAVISATLAGNGVLKFLKVATTIHPGKPEESSYLVTDGVYRFTRNPMYLGLFIGLMAFGIFLCNWISLLLPFLFSGYITRFQIQPEERILKVKFGEKYEQYLSKVRRWL